MEVVFGELSTNRHPPNPHTSVLDMQIFWRRMSRAYLENGNYKCGYQGKTKRATQNQGVLVDLAVLKGRRLGERT
ncbi:hypothetical protein BABINDRAFT_154129 [Babjeviella inositovora NRRL Y-12698]|uniref:Uncharacterized protein n=1 Tax=Babjeviella inositovora NRRL Y-12698 TaxID=984486 RepID=A0A1E3QP57_9ASCO|nr:uncharacterized protein BABINDRAFT_154129 [Babjeviella inositovora NRRL Y-12698]ODQ78862.1 hypothetical protein BABINDRAFT_154129 [Babjeviella inositovora NRRL Y-12698]